MTFQKISEDINSGKMDIEKCIEIISSPENKKKINYYANRDYIKKTQLSDEEMADIVSIVDILQVLYTSKYDSPYSDNVYDNLQEMLVSLGIPRLTGSIEINDNTKLAHNYTNLRGTLSKIYYISDNEKRTNNSRKYLREWITSMEAKCMREHGVQLNLIDEKVMLQPKFDGISCVMECDDDILWLTRGDTTNNKASDIGHVMNKFNDIYGNGGTRGVKFEIMVSENDLEKINQLQFDVPYKNSRQLVTSVINSNEVDHKSDYLFPVPLRISDGSTHHERIAEELIDMFPTTICKLGDVDAIKEYARANKYVTHRGKQYRTDGVVITLLNNTIIKQLGRTGNINNFEVAYKTTEESAYTKVKNVEFYISEFGFITPVMVINDIVLKGNTITRVSLHNKERFDEMNLSYGDTVKILYDIIPYATIDENCIRKRNGRKIEFTNKCPDCKSSLNTDVVQVKCENPECPSRLIGKILNYCNCLRIQHIGHNTLLSLYESGFLPKGIFSLYQLNKNSLYIEDIVGFGRLKTRRIVREIESKRRLYDYEFFGSIGIEGISMKTFANIFSEIHFDEFMNYVTNERFDGLFAALVSIKGIADNKAQSIVEYFINNRKSNEMKLLKKHVSIKPSYGATVLKKVIVSGWRPTKDMNESLSSRGYQVINTFNKDAICIIVPNKQYTSSKLNKAIDSNMRVIYMTGDSQHEIKDIINNNRKNY